MLKDLVESNAKPSEFVVVQHPLNGPGAIVTIPSKFLVMLDRCGVGPAWILAILCDYALRNDVVTSLAQRGSLRPSFFWGWQGSALARSRAERSAASESKNRGSVPIWPPCGQLALTFRSRTEQK